MQITKHIKPYQLTVCVDSSLRKPKGGGAGRAVKRILKRIELERTYVKKIRFIFRLAA